jgi:serine/threonine-protein kinase
VTEARDPASGLVGTVLAGRYRIIELLGEGAMGAVYLGEHVKMGRRDAIKVLRDSLATDREATLRFLRGARNVSLISHPNVCTIYDFSDTADGLQFMAMEFVPGETLKDLVDREGRLPIRRAVHIAAQTADALQAAHDAGIVHRDLKPGNIMLMRDREGHDQVKVVDFDIAKAADADGEEVTRMGFVVGTPEYMSPEQLMGEHLDGRSDVYSLALVLFRMLTGSLPFRAETTQDVMIQRLTHVPIPLADALPGAAFPERLQHAIARALERRPADRWANAVEFGREITAAATAPGDGWSAPLAQPRTGPSAGIPATRIAPASGSAQPAAVGAPRKQRRNLAAAATLVLVLVIVVAAVVWQGRNVNGEAQPDDTDLAAAHGTGASDGDVVAGAAQDSARPADPVVTPSGDVRPPRDTGDPPVSGGGAGTSGGTAVDPPPGIVVPAERAAHVLFQQLDRFPPIAAAAPTASELAAIIDTARAVWGQRMLALPDRALAAYVLGSAYDARSDWPRCVAWLDSALALNPAGAGYSELRTKCRDLDR